MFKRLPNLSRNEGSGYPRGRSKKKVEGRKDWRDLAIYSNVLKS